MFVQGLVQRGGQVVDRVANSDIFDRTLMADE